MRMLTPVFLLCYVVGGQTFNVSIPQPKLTDIRYWGSACPDGGLSATIGATNATMNTSSFTFTLANFLPALGTFGSSLRMCSIVGSVTIDEGWKVVVNEQGTYVEGTVDLPDNAAMFLRTTYSFAESTDIQSVGMFDVRGPLHGSLRTQIMPNQGAPGLCTGGELNIEFQSRAVDDASITASQTIVDNTAWRLTTAIKILPC